MCVVFAFSCTKNEENDVADNETLNNVSHSIEVKHVSFDDPNVGIIVSKGDENTKIAPGAPTTIVEELMYANGYMVAGSMNEAISTFRLNSNEKKLSNAEISAFLQGLIDSFSEIKLSDEYFANLETRLKEYVDDIQKQKTELAKKYFEELEKQDGIIKTESGLLYKKIEEGSGAKIEYDDAKVNVDYSMNVFDNFAENKKTPVDSNNGISFNVNALIPGVIEGMKLMREGDKFEFYIPPQLGYGEYGAPPMIAPNSYLIFEIKVNKIEIVSESGKDKPAVNEEGNSSENAPDESNINNSEAEAAAEANK